MTGRRQLPGGRFSIGIAIITIFAIAGTLSSCGRYGSPVRVAASADTMAPAVEPAEEEATSTKTTKAKIADESSDGSE
jgi:hypothetical protein